MCLKMIKKTHIHIYILVLFEETISMNYYLTLAFVSQLRELKLTRDVLVLVLLALKEIAKLRAEWRRSISLPLSSTRVV